MIRLLARTVLTLLANALGLFMASLILSGFTINNFSFVLAVVIFTVVQVVLDPLITKIALTNVPALRGGVAFVTTLVSLIITSLISSGISISGFDTWILATLIVWLFSLIGVLLLPLVMFRKTLANHKN